MSKSLILTVHRTHVKHKPCIWPSSPQVQRSSVVRASDGCTVGHIGSINVGDSDFFFVLCSWDVEHRSHFFAALHQETSIFYFRGKINHKTHPDWASHTGLLHLFFRRLSPSLSCGSFSPGSTLAPILIHFMSERKQWRHNYNVLNRWDSIFKFFKKLSHMSFKWLF